MNKKYRLTENFSSMLNLAKTRTKSMFKDAFFFHLRQYKAVKKKAGPVDAVGNFMRHIDETLGAGLVELDKDIGDKISCRKGCSFCCKTPVDLTIDEAELLLKYCKQESIEVDWEKAKRQSKHDGSNWQQLSPEDQECVFLKNDMCSVYEWRPIVCRKLIVLSDAKYCDTITYPNHVVQRVNVPEVEIITSAIWNATESGTTPRMLLKAKEAHV